LQVFKFIMSFLISQKIVNKKLIALIINAFLSLVFMSFFKKIPFTLGFSAFIPNCFQLKLYLYVYILITLCLI